MSSHNNPYYGNSGGGGFMNSPSGSQGSPSAERKHPAQSLRPVVVRQILDSQDSMESNDLVIDGAEASQLTLVAQVLYVQLQATNLVMHLDDGTGQIEARQWVDAGVDTEEFRTSQGIIENQWIRVIGTIKTFQSKRHVAAQHVRPVTDPHEVYFALLEALVVHKYFTRGPPGGKTTVGNNQVTGVGQSANTAPPDNFAGLPAIERKIVLFILNSAAGDDGVDVGSISKGLGNVSAAQVSDAIEKLTEMGHIYNTIDEFHFNVSL